MRRQAMQFLYRPPSPIHRQAASRPGQNLTNPKLLKARLLETRLSSENKSSEKKPAENKASEKKSADKKPVEKTADKKAADSKSANKTSAEHKPEQKSAAKKNAFAPLALRPSLSSPSIAANPSVPIRVNATTGVPASRAALLPSLKPAPAFAMAASSTTSPLDIAAVKQAMDLAHHGRTDDATSTEGTISDPVARKLVEWVILRADETDADFSRYSAFITANPSWPGIIALRRKAELVLWQDRTDPAAVIAFFRTEPPRTAKGKFALARAMMSQGNSAGAQRACQRDPGVTTVSHQILKTRLATHLLAWSPRTTTKSAWTARLYAERR